MRLGSRRRARQRRDELGAARGGEDEGGAAAVARVARRGGHEILKPGRRLAAGEATADERTFAPAHAGAKRRVGEHQVEAARRSLEHAARAQIGAYCAHHREIVERGVARD